MRLARIIALAFLVALTGCATGQRQIGKDWYSAWAMAHNARVVTPMTGRTVRMILVPNISGDALRVKVENTMGEAPVVFSGAAIGIAGAGPAVREGSVARLTFAGLPGLTLAPGQGVYSDPVSFNVKAFEKLALSLEVQSASDVSTHHVGLTTNWSVVGARAADTSGADFEPLPEVPPVNTGQWPYYWVAALDVRSSAANGSIVFLADSITDGRCSTRDDKGVAHADLNVRWTDVLAARLVSRGGPQKGIANMGISGNRVLGRGNGPSALERLERDVLDRTGVTHVVFFEGTNDVAGNFTAAQVIAGSQQILALIRARGGIKVIGVTVIPRGRPAPTAGWTAANEKERQALNEWVRNKAGFHGVIDFDALMKDGPVVTLASGGSAPAIPAAWNCDFTHPNAAGYKAMGEFVDLKLFD